MAIAHTMPDHVLGFNADRTVEALKSELGVEQLELVVLTGLDEYVELLIEKRPPSWSWRRRVAATAIVALMLAVFAGIFHPGIRLDHLLARTDYLQVH